MEHKTHKAKNGAIHYWISEFAAPNSPALISLPGLTTDHRLFDKQMNTLQTTSLGVALYGMRLLTDYQDHSHLPGALMA